MKFPRFFEIVAVVFFGMAIFFFNGCARSLTAFEQESLSPAGAMAEDAMSEDVVLVAAFSNFSDLQKEHLDALIKYFPVPEGGDFEEWLFRLFEKKGISYLEDIQPLLGEKNRIVFGITEGDSSVGYFSFVIAHDEAFSSLKEKLSEQADFYKGDYKNMEIVGIEGAYLVKYEDVIIVLSNLDEAKASVDRLDSKKNLRNKKGYREVLKQLAVPNVGYLYLDMQGMLRQIERKGNSNISGILPKTSIGSVIESYGFILQVGEGGFRISGDIIGDKKKMKQEDVRFSDYRGDGKYFVGQIPGEDLVFYNEGMNLKLAFEDGMKASPEGYARYKTLFQTWFGMDLSKDVLPWMDGPYLFSVYRNAESLIPGITFAIDVSSDVAAAKQLIGSLSGKLTAGMSILALQFDFLPSVLQFGEVDVSEGTLSAITLDMSKIPEETQSALPPYLAFLKNERVTIYFGVVENNLVISTYGNLPAAYASEVLNDSSGYQHVVSKLSFSSGEIVYANIAEAVEYLEFLLVFLKDLGVLQENEDQQAREEAFQYVKPLKEVIFQVNAADFSTNIEGFMRVGE